MNRTEFSLRVVPLGINDQVKPASDVRIIYPLSPTAIPIFASAKCTERMEMVVRVRNSAHVESMEPLLASSPFVPTMTANPLDVKYPSRTFSGIPSDWPFQVVPPSLVSRIVPASPAIHPRSEEH